MLHGDSGAIVVSKSDENIRVYSEKMGSPDNHISIGASQEQDPFVLEMEHFLDYVQKDAPCICDGSSERESLAVVVGGFESMKTRKEVKCYAADFQ